MRYWMVAALAALVAGCAQNRELDLPAATVRPVINGGLMLPPTRAETDFEVRTFVASGAGEAEVGGAACRLESDYFTAGFASPARVALPDLGPQSPVVRIACTGAQGAGAAAIQARLARNGVGPYVGVSVGTGRRSGVGVSLGGIWDVGTRRTYPPAIYPDARILLRP